MVDVRQGRGTGKKYRVGSSIFVVASLNNFRRVDLVGIKKWALKVVREKGMMELRNPRLDSFSGIRRATC